MPTSEPNPLHAIFGARSAALVGASNKPTTMGTIQMINTLKGGFAGPVIPVHPSESPVLDQRAYRRLSDLPEPDKIRSLIPATGSAANPIDLTFSLDPGLLAETLPKLLLAEDGIDGLLMHGIQGSTFFADMQQFAGDLVSLDVEQMTRFTEARVGPLAEMASRFNKPVVTSSFFDRRDNLVRLLQDSGLPVLPTPEQAVSAMAALVRAAGDGRSDG